MITYERGEAVSETVIVVPVLLLLLVLALQLTVTFHAGNAANTAAAQGAKAAAAVGAAGERANLAVAAAVVAMDARSIGSPAVVFDADSVTVTVRISAPRIFPGLGGPVTRSASAPLEQFITEWDRIYGH